MIVSGQGKDRDEKLCTASVICKSAMGQGWEVTWLPNYDFDCSFDMILQKRGVQIPVSLLWTPKDFSKATGLPFIYPCLRLVRVGVECPWPESMVVRVGFKNEHDYPHVFVPSLREGVRKDRLKHFMVGYLKQYQPPKRKEKV